MASKKAKLEEGRQKVRMKLKEIDEQHDKILLELEELVTKSHDAANALLQEQSKVNFFKKFVRVNQYLEECFSKLFTIRLSISSETDSESDEIEDSVTSLESFNINCKAGQLPAIQNSDINVRSNMRAHVTKLNQNNPEGSNLRTSSIEAESMWISSQRHSIQSVVNETVTTESQGKIVIDLKCTEQYHRGIQPQTLKTPVKNQNIIVSGIEEIFDDSPNIFSTPVEDKEDISPMSLTITDISDIENTKQDSHIAAHSPLSSPSDKNHPLNELSHNVNIVEDNLLVEENYPNVLSQPETVAAVLSSSNESKIIEDESVSSTAFSIITTSSASDSKFTEENNIPSLPKSSFLFNECIMNENSSEGCKTPVKKIKPNKDIVSNLTIKSSPLLPKVSPSCYESGGNETSPEILNPTRKNTKRKLDDNIIQPIKTSHHTSSEEICSYNATNKDENLAEMCKIFVNTKPNQDDGDNDDDSNQSPKTYSSPKDASLCNENLSKVMCNASVKNNKQSQDEVLNKPMLLSPKKLKSLNGCNENEKTLKLCETPFKNAKPNHVSLPRSINSSPNEIPCNVSVENERLSPVCKASDKKNTPNQCDSSAQPIKISPKKSPVSMAFNEKETLLEELKTKINTELSSDASSQSVKIPLHPSNKKANLVNETKYLPTKEAPPNLPQQQLHSLSKLNKKAIVNNCDTNLMEKPSVHESMVAFPDISERMLAMIATEFQDPSDIWMHLPSDQLEPLVNSMIIYYTRGEENITVSKPCVGLICSALFTLDNCWYRAQILEILQAPSKGNISDCQVRVLYIDYGNSEVLPVSKLMVLKKEFMTLPRHAIHCSLARICPIGKPKWSPEDSKFLAEIINKPLQGTCKRIKNSDNFEIELYQIDEDGNSKNISDFLVEQQRAQYYVKENSIPVSNKPHQFPASDSDGRNPGYQKNTVSPRKLSPSKGPISSKGSKKYIDNPLSLETLSSPQKCTCNADKDSNIFHCRVHDWPDNPEANLKLDKSSTSNKITNTINMKEKSEDNLNLYPTLDSLAKLRIVDCIMFTMSYISSPGEFYIHLIDSKSDSIKDLLNDFYDRHELDPKYIFTHVPPIGTICCTKFSVDNLWYRASITEFEPGLKEKSKMDNQLPEIKLAICFIDYGNSESKLLSEIHLLDPMFFEFPIQTICCSLAGIEPLSEETHKSEWSKAAKQQFMSMTDFESGFIGIVHKEEPCQSEQNSTNLKLFVIDQRQQKKILINNALVSLGLAKKNLSKSIKISPQGIWCIPEDASSEEYLSPIFSEAMSALDVNSKESEENSFSDWDPMAEDFGSIENTYTATSNDYPGAFNKNCTNDMDIVSFPEIKTNIPQVGSWVAVQVSAIVENLKFSVLFPYGMECLKKNKNSGAKKADDCEKENLSDLIEAMTSHYSKIRQMDKDPFLPSLGEIVAARINDYNRWYRAKVTQVDYNTDDIKVIYLDYGNSEWVNQKFVRKILPQFLQLPIQGVLCNLNDVEIKDGCRKQARDYFESLVESKILVAHVLLKDVEDVIHVDLYDTSNENDININQKLKEMGLAHSKNTVYVGTDDSLIPG